MGAERAILLGAGYLAFSAACYSSAAGDDATDVAEAGDVAADLDVALDADRDGEDSADPDGMVFIPAGKALIGARSTPWVGDDPVHEVYLSPFYIDRYEVTTAEYERCVVAGGCSEPSFPTSLTRPFYYGDPAFADYPVLAVSREDAMAFCAWVGKRLPTNAEWEKAGRGGCEVRGDPSICEPDLDAPVHSWGVEMGTCERANVLRSCVGDTARVGSFPGDVSPYGVFDADGNASEWVSDWFVQGWYEHSPYVDPTGPTDEEAREQICEGSSLPSGPCPTLRGGSFSFYDPRGTDPPGVTMRRMVLSSGLIESFRCGLDAE